MRPSVRYWSVLSSMSLGLACWSGGCSSPPTGAPVGNPNAMPPTTVTTPSTTVPKGPTFVVATFAYKGQTFPYQVFVPAGFDATKKWPVVIYINGSGTRGNDNTRQMQGGLPQLVRNKPGDWPAVMVFPQVPRFSADDKSIDVSMNATREEFLEAFPRIVDEVVRTYSGDVDRLVLTGWSQGGLMMYEIAAADPRRYAAFASVAGAICVPCVNGDETSPPSKAYATIAEQLKALPIVHYHGVDDRVAPVSLARDIKAAFLAARATSFSLVELPNRPHDIQLDVYDNPSIRQWLLTQRRK